MKLITEITEDLQYITEVADEETGLKDYLQKFLMKK